jgi:hypothetical protein
MAVLTLRTFMPAQPDELDLQRNYERMSDRWLTILETRFDTILPMLVTKADLAELKAELKAEIRAESARTVKWITTMFITMSIGFGGMSLTMMSRFQQ